MRVRALNQNHDWQFGKGANDYLRDNAAIAQNINTRLNSFLGNCFFDLTAGIDWFNLLGSKDRTALNLSISTVILNTTEVTGMLQLSTGLNVARQFTVNYRVQTVYSIVANTFVFDSSIG